MPAVYAPCGNCGKKGAHAKYAGGWQHSTGVECRYCGAWYAFNTFGVAELQARLVELAAWLNPQHPPRVEAEARKRLKNDAAAMARALAPYQVYVLGGEATGLLTELRARFPKKEDA